MRAGANLELLALLPPVSVSSPSERRALRAADHKSSLSRPVATALCSSRAKFSSLMLNPICVSQPCSLTERKKGRVGSVVMPYILSSTLRRMSTVSTLSNASSGLSSGSASSDGPPSQESVPLHPLHPFKRSALCLSASYSRPPCPQRSQDLGFVPLGGGQQDRQEEQEGVEREQVPGPAGEAAGRR